MLTVQRVNIDSIMTRRSQSDRDYKNKTRKRAHIESSIEERHEASRISLYISSHPQQLHFCYEQNHSVVELNEGTLHCCLSFGVPLRVVHAGINTIIQLVRSPSCTTILLAVLERHFIFVRSCDRLSRIRR